jgi:hypothetical protein
MPRYISYIDDTTRENMSPTHHNTLVGDVDHTPKPPLDNRRSAHVDRAERSTEQRSRTFGSTTPTRVQDARTFGCADRDGDPA